MKKAPCADCERKGCGSYHDQCEAYQEYKKNLRKAKKSIRDDYDPISSEEAFVHLPKKSLLREIGLRRVI